MKYVPILTYHSLDDTGSPISISPPLFRRQVLHLHQNGWRTISLDDLLAGHARGEWLARTCLLTFDDGCRNFVEEALPILAECRFSATVFVIPGWVGRANVWPGQSSSVPRRELMNWVQLRSVAEAGIAIGAHSFSHPHLVRLAEREIEREVVQCKQALEERIGQSVESFAYPYGESSPAIEEVVGRNFKAGFGTRLGFATPASRPTVFERIDAYYLREAHLFTALESGWLRLYLHLRRQLRRLRGQ